MSSERAGFATSLGTKPPLCFMGTLRRHLTPLHENVFAQGGGHKSSDFNPAKGPAKSELDMARGTGARPILRTCGPIPNKWGVSPINWGRPRTTRRNHPQAQQVA